MKKASADGNEEDERGEDSSQLSSDVANMKRPASKPRGSGHGRGRGNRGRGRGRAKNKPQPIPDLSKGKRNAEKAEDEESKEPPKKRPAARSSSSKGPKGDEKDMCACNCRFILAALELYTCMQAKSI